METKQPNGFEELKQCYITLHIDPSASPAAIKRQYRHLVKQWHPDRYPSGSREQAEASAHMQQINDAYQRIRHAPLRYYVARESKLGTKRVKIHVGPIKPLYTDADISKFAAANARGEKLLRFFSGVVFGALISVTWATAVGEWTPTYLLLSLAFAVILGYLSARYGDEFWRDMARMIMEGPG